MMYYDLKYGSEYDLEAIHKMCDEEPKIRLIFEDTDQWVIIETSLSLAYLEDILAFRYAANDVTITVNPQSYAE